MILEAMLITAVAAALAIAYILHRKNMHVWLWSYLWRIITGKPSVDGTVHVMFCFVDHFEPQWRNKDIDIERARVDRWVKDYPLMAEKHRDADGQPPKHCFFYPEEEYREEHLAKLSDLCAKGFGEIEIHIHHDNDNAANFTQLISNFAEVLHKEHGALPVDPETGQIKYAFIHGNWALDNSLPDGRHCGIDNELQVLQDTGCYVDMTLPSAPSPAQTKKVNAIYYAKGVPGRRKNHNTGSDAQVGKSNDGLLLIQGPLGINFKWLTPKGMPHIENSDIRKTMPPLKSRIDQWVKSHIHVKGKPEWIFIKIHTHGAQESDMDTLLGAERDQMHHYLEQEYNDGDNFSLHYVSAREMFNIVKAAEDGLEGNPNDYRDYVLKKPKFKAF